jgi:DNA-binding GntR family transcriptional regulator
VVDQGYRDIADRLRESIERGEYMPRDRIPTEHELAEDLAVARETVTKALKLLKQEGRLISVRGRGTYVAEPPVKLTVARYGAVVDPDRELRDLGPWETACALQGREGRSELVAVDRVPADPRLARRLNVDEGTDLIHRQRNMTLDGQVAQLQDAWMPAALVNGTPLATSERITGGVYAAMTQAGIRLASVSEELSARAAATDERKRLKLGDVTTVFEVWRTTRDHDDRIVEVLRVVADAQRCMFAYDNLPIVPDGASQPGP